MAAITGKATWFFNFKKKTLETIAYMWLRQQLANTPQMAGALEELHWRLEEAPNWRNLFKHTPFALMSSTPLYAYVCLRNERTKSGAFIWFRIMIEAGNWSVRELKEFTRAKLLIYRPFESSIRLEG